MSDQSTERFFVTFGSQYPTTQHPRWSAAHHDGWLEVEAANYNHARALTHNALGPAWSMIYTLDDWLEEDSQKWYPLGKLGVLTSEGLETTATWTTSRDWRGHVVE